VEEHEKESPWKLGAVSESASENERRTGSSYNYDSCCVISPAVARCCQ